jgi:hypothetical protein
MKGILKQEFVSCRGCIYYYVTWDKKSPYGCKALGFKSKLSPSTVVFQNSGIQCLKFQKKITTTN